MTKKTTTKTTTYSTSVEDLTLDDQSITQSADALATAVAEDRAATAEVKRAEEALASTKRSITRGNPDVGSRDLIEAQTTLEAASLRADGTARRLRQVRSTQAVTHTDLLAALEPALTGMLTGVPVFWQVGSAPSGIEEQPAIVVSQKWEAVPQKDSLTGTAARTGALSGKVTLTYLKPSSIYRDLDRHAVSARLSAHGIEARVKVDKQSSAEGVDVLILDVLSAVAPTPRLPHTPKQDQGWPSGQGYLRNLLDVAGASGWGSQFSVRTGGSERSVDLALRSPANSSRITSVTTENGIRTTVVEVAGFITVGPGARLGSHAIAPALAEAAGVHVGKVTDHGRITSCTFKAQPGQDLLNAHGGFVGVLTLECISK